MTAPKRRWFRFSLRTLFVVLTVLACYLGSLVHHARQQRIAITAIEAVDGYWYFDYQYDPPDGWYAARTPPGPSLIWKLIPQEAFFDVVGVGLNCKPASDKTVLDVCRLDSLQVLDLASANGVTDASLTQLARMDQLTYLRLDGTGVSARAVAEYQRSHPKVEVMWFPAENERRLAWRTH